MIFCNNWISWELSVRFEQESSNGQKSRKLSRKSWPLTGVSDSWVWLGLLVDACPCCGFYCMRWCGAFVSIVRHHDKKMPLSTDWFLILNWNASCGSKWGVISHGYMAVCRRWNFWPSSQLQCSTASGFCAVSPSIIRMLNRKAKYVL